MAGEKNVKSMWAEPGQGDTRQWHQRNTTKYYILISRDGRKLRWVSDGMHGKKFLGRLHTECASVSCLDWSIPGGFCPHGTWLFCCDDNWTN